MCTIIDLQYYFFNILLHVLLARVFVTGPKKIILIRYGPSGTYKHKDNILLTNSFFAAIFSIFTYRERSSIKTLKTHTRIHNFEMNQIITIKLQQSMLHKQQG